MIALTHLTPTADRLGASRPPRRSGRAVFLALACVLFGLIGSAGIAQAASNRAQGRQTAGSTPVVAASSATAAGPVAFPAAAGIRPVAQPVGPEQIQPEPNALNSYVHPDDMVIFDAGNSGTTPGTINVINGGFSGTFGAVTVVASASVGSGYTFHAGVYQGCVSPSQQLYYWDDTLKGFVSIDLTQSSYPRTIVPIPSNPALVPGDAYLSNEGPVTVWDYSTGTILYLDNGSSTAKSTIPRGIYRYNPITGTNTLYAPYTGGTVQSLAIKQDGSAVYVFNEMPQTLGTSAVCSLLAPGSGALTTVDGGSTEYGTTATSPRYYEAASIFWDIVNQKINIFDVGDDQTTSRIIRLAPAVGNAVRTFISNGSAGPTATYGGTLINGPGSGFTNTAGRILYTEEDVNLTIVFPATIASGSPTSTRVGTSQFSNEATVCSYIPPTLPTITTPTATAGSNGTTATLGANVTSSGVAIVAPTVQTRGVVYSPTSTNANPAIGGTGVTQLASTAATGTFTVSASGLTAGTAYSYAGYVSSYYGTVYTAVSTFTTAAAPTVTSPTATAITGVSATLGGNITSDGGGGISSRGVVYSTSANSTNPVIGGSGVTNLTDATATTGVFTDGTGNVLANGTAYSFRAYATNGVGTSYSVAGVFTTAAKPTANSQSVTTSFNTAKAITLTGSDPNNPAQTLTYAVTVNPTHGTLSGTAPNLTYTPTAGYQGADSFQFTTTNTSNLTSSAATVSITVTAGTPTANPQSVSVPFNTATAVTLTATDPDSPALSLTYTVATAPAHGTLSGTSPNLTYTPTANYQGSDSFTFTANNGTNTSNTATVTITVAAGTPTANAQAVTTAFNTAKAITLTGTDPDSPALALTYTIAATPTHGTLSGTAPNLTYTPTANYQGADSFTFTVSNGQKTSSASTVSLTVAAGIPTANPQAVNVNLNLPAVVTLTGTDPDSPALALTYTVATQPANGTLSGTAPNLTYTPNTGYSGSDSFTFTVSNGQKTSSAATVSLSVIGEPTISSFTPASGAAGTTVTITGTNLQNAGGLNFFRNVAGTGFTVVSSTQVSVVVPAGAKTGLLTVLTGSGSNNSSTKFTVVVP